MIDIGSTIYIAGPMRGYPLMNFPQFFYWQIQLENSGYKVINPAAEDCKRWFKDGWVFRESEWRDVLEYDKMLIRSQADALFVLDGWKDSEGALEEIELAVEIGIDVFYEDKPVLGCGLGCACAEKES